MTSGQVIKYIRTAEEQGATVESIQRAYESGIIAAALNPAADFSRMPAIMELLGLQLNYRGVFNGVSSETDISDYGFVANSAGLTGQGFIVHWGEKFRSTSTAKDVVGRTCFRPTWHEEYRMQILFGADFSNDDRHKSKILAEATRRGYRTLPIEAALLLREAISDDILKRLGLYRLIGMHEPVRDSSGRQSLLGISSQNGSFVIACESERNGVPWLRTDGFVFLGPKA